MRAERETTVCPSHFPCLGREMAGPCDDRYDRHDEGEDEDEPGDDREQQPPVSDRSSSSSSFSISSAPRYSMTTTTTTTMTMTMAAKKLLGRGGPTATALPLLLGGVESTSSVLAVLGLARRAPSSRRSTRAGGGDLRASANHGTAMGLSVLGAPATSPAYDVVWGHHAPAVALSLLGTNLRDVIGQGGAVRRILRRSRSTPAPQWRTPPWTRSGPDA